MITPISTYQIFMSIFMFTNFRKIFFLICYSIEFKILDKIYCECRLLCNHTTHLFRFKHNSHFKTRLRKVEEF